MGDINKKISVWILIGALIAFALFILGALWFPFASAVPRGGYCGIKGVGWRDWIRVIIGLIIPILSIYFALKALIIFKRINYKIIRIISVVLSVISLIGSILIIVLLIYSFVGSLGGCDIAIKVNLAALRESANRYAQNNNGSYEDFCNDSEDVALVAEGIKNNASKLFCNDTSEEWAACTDLKQYKKGEYFCADSSGKAQTIPGECDENWKYTSCPVE